MNTLDRLLQVMSNVFDVPRERLSEASSADDVANWDSANVLHLTMAIESEFQITLTPDDMADMLSVKIILEILKNEGIE